jgi:Anaphase promoting complex subunit 8 / Cdc23
MVALSISNCGTRTVRLPITYSYYLIEEATVHIFNSKQKLLRSMSSQARNSYRSPFLSPLTPSHIHPSSTVHELNSNSRPVFIASAQKSSATEENQETVEVVWNPIQVQVDLQKACQILTQRQLKCSAKWMAEMAVGLSISADAPPEEDLSSTIPDHFWLTSSVTNHSALFQYARTLFDLGEYAMAASVLSVGTPGVAESALTGSMPAPLPNLSAPEVFLRSYALYMAGEKCKEEQILELERCVFSTIPQSAVHLQIGEQLNDSSLFSKLLKFTAMGKRILYVLTRS